MPNYRRYYTENNTVFLTIVTKNREPWILKYTNQIFESMHFVKNKHKFKNKAYIFLPDHIHWIIELVSDSNFSTIVGSFKRDVTWRLKKKDIFIKWQNRFYDHVIRDDNDLLRHIDYIHFNSVKHGLVKKPGLYEFSSFNEWKKRGMYADNWGVIEPDRIRNLELD